MSEFLFSLRLRCGVPAILLAVGLAVAGCGQSDRPPAPPPKPTADPKPVVPSARDRAPTRAEMVQIQSLLLRRGYDPGPVDGLYGRKTGAAIGQYQAASRLPVNGNASLELLEHLRGQPSTAPEVVAVEAAVETATYEVGERYLFTDGALHDVVGLGPGRVKWRTSHDEEFSASPAIGAPVVEWAYGPWRGTARSTLAPDTPWPPAKGVETAFTVLGEEWNIDAGQNAPRQTSETRWTCRSEGAATTETIAGAFQTEVLTCERWPVPAGAWQKRVWHYAPRVGHFVRRTDFDGAGMEIESLELAAAMPGGSKARRTALTKLLRGALKDRAVGDPLPWNDPGGGARFVLTITRDFKGPAGVSCRSYKFDRAAPEPRREFPAVSCYDKKKKRWRAPGME